MKSITGIAEEEGEIRSNNAMRFAQIQRRPNRAGFKGSNSGIHAAMSYKRQRLELGLSAVVKIGGLVLEDDDSDISDEIELTTTELLNKWTMDLKKKMLVEDPGNSQNRSQDILESESDDDTTNVLEKNSNQPAISHENVLESESDDDTANVVENNSNQSAISHELESDDDTANVVEKNSNQSDISHEDMQIDTTSDFQGSVAARLFPYYVDSETLHDVDFVEVQCSCGSFYEIVCVGSNFFVRTNTNETFTPANGTSSYGQITIECSCKRTFVVKKTDDQLMYATFVR